MAWPTDPRPAKSLVVLRDQILRSVPNAPKGEFGMIGDQAHQQRASDHNPSNGIVHALDIPHYPSIGLDCEKLATHMRTVARDSRTKYVIWNLHIFGDDGYAKRNGRKAWTLYSASNHEHHLHVSVNEGASADDEREWDIGPIAGTGESPPTTRPLLKRGSTGTDVKLVQSLLMTDGIYGPATEDAVARFQREQGTLDVDGIVGPETWRALERLMEPPEPGESGEWQTDITATVFGGTADTQKSAYDNHVITNAEFAVSLPHRFSGARPRVEVVGSSGKSATGTIEDVGPWLTDDPYWDLGTRPVAETYAKAGKALDRGPQAGRVPNGAGIDLSPAMAKAVGISGKGSCKWRFL